MSYCFTSSLQFTAVVPFFVFQWKCFHDHCVWRGFAQWCLAAPFELSVDWNSILLSSAVTQLCTFSGNLHFWWRLLADLCVCVEAEAWYFKGLQTRVWQQACRWLHRQVPGRKPTPLVRITDCCYFHLQAWKRCTWHCRRTHCSTAEGWMWEGLHLGMHHCPRQDLFTPPAPPLQQHPEVPQHR